jgi:hypothetical protein
MIDSKVTWGVPTGGVPNSDRSHQGNVNNSSCKVLISERD